jgi:hypothetical protein
MARDKKPKDDDLDRLVETMLKAAELEFKSRDAARKCAQEAGVVIANMTEAQWNERRSKQLRRRHYLLLCNIASVYVKNKDGSAKRAYAAPRFGERLADDTTMGDLKDLDIESMEKMGLIRIEGNNLVPTPFGLSKLDKAQAWMRKSGKDLKP